MYFVHCCGSSTQTIVHGELFTYLLKTITKGLLNSLVEIQMHLDKFLYPLCLSFLIYKMEEMKVLSRGCCED